MGRLKLRRPSPAMLVAMVALAIALGGTSWASSSKRTKRSAPKHADSSQDRALIKSMAGGLSVKFAKSAGSARHATLADRATTAAPSGAAGGDLQGSYPNPTLRAPVVTQLALQTAQGIDCTTHPLTLCRGATDPTNNYWNQPTGPAPESYAGVIRDGLGFVHFQGTVEDITNIDPLPFEIGVPVFHLPPSMTPPADLTFIVWDEDQLKPCGLEVNHSGAVEMGCPSTTIHAGDHISLSGVSFRP